MDTQDQRGDIWIHLLKENVNSTGTLNQHQEDIMENVCQILGGDLKEKKFKTTNVVFQFGATSSAADFKKHIQNSCVLVICWTEVPNTVRPPYLTAWSNKHLKLLDLILRFFKVQSSFRYQVPTVSSQFFRNPTLPGKFGSRQVPIQVSTTLKQKTGQIKVRCCDNLRMIFNYHIRTRKVLAYTSLKVIMVNN